MRLINGDCLIEMDALINEGIKVDMILCDPPYGLTKNKWDCVIDIDALWDRWKRLIKCRGAIAVFGQDKFSARMMLSNRKWHRYNIIWLKTTPTGFLNANRMPLRIHEDIMIFYNKLPTFNPQKTTGHTPVHSYTKHTSDGSNYGKTQTGISGGGSTERYPTSVLLFRTDKQKCSLHPTQKSVELCSYLIRTYTNETDLVLDCCMGSGSTGVAAKLLNRKFIGIELDRKYFEAAKKRVELA